jgi:Fe2+ transport system protein FeoA
MATQFTCPLCGFGFDPAAHLACQTCPLHSGCHLVCCPSCGHTTVDQGQSRIVRWISSLLERLAAQPEPAVPDTAERASAATSALADIPLGQRARVVGVGALPGAQREQLHGYGILPGRVLRVVQRTPLIVVQVEHAELAIETEVARGVWVDELS